MPEAARSGKQRQFRVFPLSGMINDASEASRQQPFARNMVELQPDAIGAQAVRSRSRVMHEHHSLLAEDAAMRIGQRHETRDRSGGSREAAMSAQLRCPTEVFHA
jgi:hypothetical protein